MTAHIAGSLVQVSAFAYPVFRAWRLAKLIHKSLAGDYARAEPQAGRGGGAEQRAEALLRDLLGESEYEQLVRRGYLEVASPGHEHRVYRISLAGDLVKAFERSDFD